MRLRDFVVLAANVILVWCVIASGIQSPRLPDVTVDWSEAREISPQEFEASFLLL